MPQLVRLQLAAIAVSQQNARKNMEAGSEDAGIDDLARSIQENGLLNPPTVRPTGKNHYEVVAGQRRVLACQRLGWTEIDVLVSDLSDDKALGASLVENLQRADMDPMDKARGLDQLCRRLGSDRDAARATGLSISTVRKYLLLLALPEDLRSQLGTSQGPAGIGVMAQLSRQFSNDAEQAREAWGMISEFKGGTAEELLRQSEGDLVRLGELRDLALEGKFNVVRCGAELSSCPWVLDLPQTNQQAIIEAARIR